MSTRPRLDGPLRRSRTIAVLSCLLAWLAWIRPNIVEPQRGVTLLPGRPSQLQRVRWQDAAGTLALRRASDGRYQVWPGADGASLPYPMSAQGDDLLTHLLPLQANRKLGRLTTEQAAAVGLVPPQATLVLTVGELDHVFRIGRPAYGTGELYAVDGQGAAFLLRASLLANLGHGGLALQDRALIAPLAAQLQRIELQAQGISRTFLHRYPEEPSRAFFADAAEPERKLIRATAFFEQVLQLRATGLEAQAPTEAADVTLTLTGAGDATGWVKLYRRTGVPVAVSSHQLRTAVLAPSCVAQVFDEVAGVLAEAR